MNHPFRRSIAATVGLALIRIIVVVVTVTAMANNGQQGVSTDDGACASLDGNLKLFLTSSGCTTPGMKQAWTNLYDQAVQDTGGSRTIVYVPTAMMTRNTNDVLGQARYVAQQLSVPDVKVLELVDLNENGALHALDNACCVYIEMGNTYFVTYHVRRTGLDQAIEKLLANGGLYAGASAGAILAGHTIRTCEWKNWDDPGHGTEWDLRNTPWKLEGLHLLKNDASVFVHYNDEWERRVKEMQPKHKEPVIIMDEYHAYVQDKHHHRGGRLVP
jgi:peptidase E